MKVTKYMTNNDFIISLLNLNKDEIKSLDVVEVNSVLDMRVKLIDQHPVCPFCGGHTKIKEYKNVCTIIFLSQVNKV